MKVSNVPHLLECPKCKTKIDTTGLTENLWKHFVFLVEKILKDMGGRYGK